MVLIPKMVKSRYLEGYCPIYSNLLNECTNGPRPEAPLWSNWNRKWK